MLTHRDQKQRGRRKTKAERRAEVLEKAKPLLSKICRPHAKPACPCSERRQR